MAHSLPIRHDFCKKSHFLSREGLAAQASAVRTGGRPAEVLPWLEGSWWQSLGSEHGKGTFFHNREGL